MPSWKRSQAAPALLASILLAVPPAAAQLTSVGSQYFDQDSAGIAGDYEIGDLFGFSLAAADFNCDGYDDLAIGVPWEDVTFDCDGDGTADPNECVEAGAVHIIYGSAFGLHASAGGADQLIHQGSSGVPSSPEPGDHFGWSVAGVRTHGSDCWDLAVGAPDEDVQAGPVNHQNAGAVFYFRGTAAGLEPDGLFVQGQDWVPDTPEAFDRFGFSIAQGPMLRGPGTDPTDCPPGVDGDSSLAIGAPGEGYGLTDDDEGVVVVVVAPCDGNDTGGDGNLPYPFTCSPLTDQAAHCQVIEPGTEATVGRAGEALAGAGPWYEDEPSRYLAIGARLDAADESASGRVFVWGADVTDGDFVRERPLYQGLGGSAGTPEGGDGLGASVALGDFDGDGDVDLAAGVPWEAVDGDTVTGAGGVSTFYSVYVSAWGTRIPSGSGPPVGQFFDQDTTHFNASETDDHFGEELVAGDFDGDGRDDLVIGVPDENLGGDQNAGMIHVLYGSASGLTTAGDQAFDLDDPDLPGSTQARDYFGQALAVGDFDGDGRDDLAVGAPGAATETDTGGGVFVMFGGLPGGYLDAVDFDRSQFVFGEGGTIPVTMERTGNLTQPLNVVYRYLPTEGTATVGEDFIHFSGSLSWAAGEGGTKSFNLGVISDTVDEPNETIVLNVDVSDHCLEPADWTIVISDNDPNVAGTFQFSSALQTRIESGGPATVTVTRVAGTLGNVQVTYGTADGEAVAGSDYVQTNGVLVFGLNELSKSFQVPILDDPLVEPTWEPFTVNLLGVTGGGTLGAPAVQTIRIQNDAADFVLFVDGFESGGTGFWDFVTP